MNLKIILAFFAIQCEAFNRFCRGSNCRSAQLTEHECLIVSKDIFNKAFMKDPKSIFIVSSSFKECELVDRFYRAYLVDMFPNTYSYRR